MCIRDRAYVRQAMENKPAEVSLLADAPHMYALAWTDEAVNLPSVSSRYDAADRSVPFLQMVYSGLMPYALMPVNLSADPQDSFQMCIRDSPYHGLWNGAV